MPIINALALDVGEAEVEIAGDAVLQVAVEVNLGELLGELGQHAITQSVQALRLGAHLRLGDAAGFAQADAERRRQRAGTHPALLAAAADQRLQPHPRAAAHVERADALRPVDLVAGDAHQVDPHRLDVERDLADRLRRVGVEERLVLAAQPADLGERLDDADLVVHRHDGHQGRRIVGDRRAQLLEVDQAVLAAPADRSPRIPRAPGGGSCRGRTCAR